MWAIAYVVYVRHIEFIEYLGDIGHTYCIGYMGT